MEAKAEQLLASVEQSLDLSTVDRLAIAAAITDDLRAASGHAVGDEQRLAKVEAQTHALAEAVIAITNTVEAIAPAVQAVKDEM